MADCSSTLDLGLHPVIIFLDNTAALTLIDKMGASAKTAHFLRWQYYLRSMVMGKQCTAYFTPTKYMLADPMTKVVDQATLTQFIQIVFNAKNRFTRA